ncbi:MAG: thiol peroxidase [Verrucomicrobia bacterium]|nr:thiol peroxidase [Verrucomicrobiota bacterium]
MATVKFKGAPIHTNGELPAVGSKAPDFTLTDGDLKDRSLKEFIGKRVLISIVPSLDTGTCALSAKKFNDAAKNNPHIVVLFASADLPFAQKRMCTADNLENIATLSMMRSKDFATKYGVLITDGPLAGLAARAVVALDENANVLYTELVDEITQEPNYTKALEALL